LPRYIVDQLHQLTSVDLAFNDLVWLDVGAFSSASLRHVDLSHNALRKLVSMTFLYLPSIVDIDLSYNKVIIDIR
jgi:Leucine-rich repeat (LRR) protein